MVGAPHCHEETMHTDREIRVEIERIEAIVDRFLSNAGKGLPTDYDQGVKYVMDELIKEHIADGKILTTAMQLPPEWRAYALAYLTGDHGWKGRDPHLTVRLRNNSDKHVRVTEAIFEVPIIHEASHRPTGGTYNEEATKILAPGETIDLDPDRAIQALGKYCLKASFPSTWNRWGGTEVDPEKSTPEHCVLASPDYLEEVAFKGKGVESAGWKSDQTITKKGAR